MQDTDSKAHDDSRLNDADRRSYSIPQVSNCDPKERPKHVDYKAFRAFLINKLSKQKGRAK